MEKKTALDEAISLVGSQEKLAKALTALKMRDAEGKVMTFAQGHVSYWKIRGWPPAEVCIGIETVTDAQITRYQLRPDVFQHPLRA